MSDRLFDFYEEKEKREPDPDDLELASSEVPERSEGVEIVCKHLDELGEEKLSAFVREYLTGRKL